MMPPTSRAERLACDNRSSRLALIESSVAIARIVGNLPGDGTRAVL